MGAACIAPSELAQSHRLPVLYGWRDFVFEGGLMSYGPDIEVLVKGAAGHVDRILKGASPAELNSRPVSC